MAKPAYRYLFPAVFLTVLAFCCQAEDRISEFQFKENGVEIKLLKPPPDRILRMARLNNPVAGVVLKTKTETIGLNLKPQPNLWEIVLPEDVREGTSVFVETVGKPRLAGDPVLVEPDAEGVIRLHAHQATIVGRMLRYEPQPHKNTIGFWVVDTDYPEWTFRVTTPGTYRVEILQGCGEGQGGSQAEVLAGDNALQFKVKETGHFQNFERRKIGRLQIHSTGNQTLKINILRIANKAAMDIRLIELIPEV